MANIKKYTYKKDLVYLNVDGENIIIKPKKCYNLDKIYKYLDDHDINSYLRPIEINDHQVIFKELEKTSLNDDELAKRLIYNLALWQNKTTSYVPLDLDKVKEIYEKHIKELNFLYAYYHDLQDMIEMKVYMHPSEYLYIRNVSYIYSALNYARHLLDEWYQKITKTTTIREVYCHGKCELSHFLGNDNGYFISLENAHLGSPVEDFLHFYNQDFEKVDMFSTFHFYQHKYPFKEEEKLYFYFSIVIPRMIDIYPSSLNKCTELVKFYDQIKKTSQFISENKEKKEHHQHN